MSLAKSSAIAPRILSQVKILTRTKPDTLSIGTHPRQRTSVMGFELEIDLIKGFLKKVWSQSPNMVKNVLGHLELCVIQGLNFGF